MTFNLWGMTLILLQKDRSSRALLLTNIAPVNLSQELFYSCPLGIFFKSVYSVYFTNPTLGTNYIRILKMYLRHVSVHVYPLHGAQNGSLKTNCQ